MKFVPMEDFYSEQFRSMYCKGLTYTVTPTPATDDAPEVPLQKTPLFKAVHEWVAENKVRILDDRAMEKFANDAALEHLPRAKVTGEGFVTDTLGAGDVATVKVKPDKKVKAGASGGGTTDTLITLLGLAMLFAVVMSFINPVAGFLISMAVTHPTAVRNGMCDFVVDQCDEGTPPGKLVMQTSGAVTVATLTFSNTAFGSASGGTATAAAITSDTNAVGGTIAKAELRNAAATAKVLCSVTATGGGGDIQLNSVVVSAGQTVAISSLTYSAPA